ncbi:MAG: septum formation initiator family protein [Myxococcota bacterium]
MLAPVVAALVYAGFEEGSGLRAWWSLRADLAGARVRIEATRLQIEQLRGETAALESDAFAIERAIREDLGLAFSGETIVRLPRAGRSNPRFP